MIGIEVRSQKPLIPMTHLQYNGPISADNKVLLTVIDCYSVRMIPLGGCGILFRRRVTFNERVFHTAAESLEPAGGRRLSLTVQHPVLTYSNCH